MGDFRTLTTWQRAHTLALLIYRVTSDLPASERFGLVSQLRRSAVSVAANLAEGSGRGSDAELTRFAGIALGSLHELEAELRILRDLGLGERQAVDAAIHQALELGRMIGALRRCLLAGVPRKKEAGLPPRGPGPLTDQRPVSSDERPAATAPAPRTTAPAPGSPRS
jgi:four helix bundle protein